jgi:hypothetical protein
VREPQQGQGPDHRKHDSDCDKRLLHYSSIRAGGVAGLTVSTSLGFGIRRPEGIRRQPCEISGSAVGVSVQ